MPTVLISRELARKFTDGEIKLALPENADTIRAVIRELGNLYPGLGDAVRGPSFAVAIDGQIYQDSLLEPVPEGSEVCFLPAIDGG